MTTIYQEQSQPAVQVQPDQPGPAGAQMYAQQPAPVVPIYQPYPNMNYNNPPPKEDPNVACMWVQYLIGTIGSVVLYACYQAEFIWFATWAYNRGAFGRANRISYNGFLTPASADFDPMGIVYNVPNDTSVRANRDQMSLILTRLVVFFVCTFVCYLIFAIVVWNGQCCSFGGCGCSGMSISARVPKLLFQITGYLLILPTISAVAGLFVATLIGIINPFQSM